MARQGEEHASKPVATLILLVRDSVDAPFQETEQGIEILPRDDFYFGRGASCTFNCQEPTVSNKHFHIHCIVYEEDEASGIPPLVYVEDLSTNGTYLTRACQITEERLTRGQNGTTLLCHGDQLRVSPNMSFLFISNHRSPPKEDGIGLSELQNREAQLFKDRFEITNRVLGLGGYGSVFAAIHKKSHRQLACKVIDVELCPPTKSPKSREPLKDVTHSRQKNHGAPETDSKSQKRQNLENQKLRIRDDPQFREIEILKTLDHPNIIRLEKVFWSVNTFYIFQELVTGGDLFSYIESKGGRLPDIEAAVILRQILKAVEYLHDRYIAHRDLKPDNILITSAAEGARIVVTDFGNARYLPENAAELHDLPAKKRRMFTVAGTLEYVAPEIHSMNPLVSKSLGYSKAVDMWSVGAITAALLTGDVIFVNRADPRFRNDPQLTLDLAAKCDLSMLDDPYTVWRTVGKRPKDLVKKLLVLDESKRMTATQSLAHDWFTNKHYADELDAVYQRSIEGWTPRRKIFRHVEALDVSRLSPSESGVGGHSGSSSLFFLSESLAAPQPSPNGWFKSGRKAVPASLPKIDEETPAELQESAASVSDVQMAPCPDVQDSCFPDPLDVQHSMGQLAINASEASTDLLMEENDLSDDRSYEFDADHEMAVGCSEDYNEPLPSLSSSEQSLGPEAAADFLSNNRKRPSSPESDDSRNIGDAEVSVESLEDLKYLRHTGTKRARVA